MRYVTSRIQTENEELAYRIYVTDSLKLAVENKYLTNRYIDFIYPDLKESQAKKIEPTADEIALSIISKAGLKVGK